MGDKNYRAHETLRDSSTRNVDSCMQEMKRKREHLEGTFFSVTDQLKMQLMVYGPPTVVHRLIVQEKERIVVEQTCMKAELILVREDQLADSMAAVAVVIDHQILN